MSRINYYTISLTIFTILVCNSNLNAFYYIQELSTIPANLLEPYRNKHHLSNSFSKIFERGLKAYSEMNYSRAEQAYNTLLLINSRDIIALERLAQVYLKQGRVSLAVNTLLKILRIEPEYHPAHNHLAQLYLYAKKPKESIRHAKYLVENGLAYVETYLSLVNAFFMLKQYDNMISICEIAKDAGASHPQFSFFTLIVHLITGNFSQFKADYLIFKNEYKQHPDLILYQYLIAVFEPNKDEIVNFLLENEDDIHRTKSKLRRASFHHPVYPYMFLALAMESLADTPKKDHLWNQAIEMTRKAIKVAENFILPHKLALDILRNRRDFSKLLDEATRSVNKFPSYIRFLEYQGEAAFFLGKTELALSALQEALKSRNSNPNYLAYTAILMLQKTGVDPQEALALIDLALNQDSTNPFAQTALGLFYFNAGESQRSLISLRQAIKKNIKHPLAWNLTIQAYLKDNNINEAYKTALLARTIVKDESIYKQVIELAFQRKEYKNCINLSQEALGYLGQNSYFDYLTAKSHIAEAEAKGKAEALNDYRNALTALKDTGIKVDNPENYNLLYLDILMALELYEQAESNIKKLLKFHTRNPRYQAFLGNYYYIRKYPKKLEDFETDEAFQKAKKLQKTKDRQKALDIFETLIKMTGSREYFSETGWLKFLQKKKRKAEADLILATTQGTNKTRALAHYRLGLIYALDKTKEQESSKNYTRAYELAPNLAEAKKDHQVYSEITDIPSEKAIIKKMERLYIQ